MHSHQHEHHSGTAAVLGWSLAATLAFVAVEVAAGLQAHSLALLSDAGHNFTDGLALVLSWFGFYLQSKPADESKTYGYHRAGVLVASVNALALAILAGWIFYQSALRFRQPQPVHEGTMLVVAALGLAVNGGIMLALRSASRGDLNIRSAFLHMLGDAAGSAAIVAGALVIRYTGWEQVDPVLSMLIGGLIVWTAWGIIREALNILLEGLPSGIRLMDVIAAMRAHQGVLDVHDLHIWSLGSSTHALSCHVLIEDVPLSSSDAILRGLNELLEKRFQICHTTIQFEHVSCAISANGCAIPVRPHSDEPNHPHENSPQH